MPHKKAKHSVREEERRLKGSDLAPKGSHASLEAEPIPKSFARVLNASSLRDEYRKRKRDGAGNPKDSESGQRKKRKVATDEPLQLLPGESLKNFNRRVEDSMRPQIRSAVQAGQANARRQDAIEKEERAARKGAKVDTEEEEKQKGSEKEDTATLPDPLTGKKSGDQKGAHTPITQTAPKGKTEFDVTSSRNPKRLNDVVMAPPDMLALLKKNKVLQKTKDGEVFGKKDIIPPEQKRMMEIEREKAIKRYRELKEKRQDGR